jgi:hypothetical protein
MRGFSRRKWIAYFSNTAAILALILAASAHAQRSPLPTAQQTCTVNLGKWFASGSPTLNGLVNPANSLAFPANAGAPSNPPIQPTGNCAFYQWSHQMFLWLTSPTTSQYGGSGRVFDSPVFFDVSAPPRVYIPHVPGFRHSFAIRAAQVDKNRFPITFSKTGQLLEIQPARLGPTGKPLIRNQAGQQVEVANASFTNGKPVFQDAKGNAIAPPRPSTQAVAPGKATVVHKFLVSGRPVFVDDSGAVVEVEEGQAGGGDVLMAQNGSLIYYASIVNDVFAYFQSFTQNGVFGATGSTGATGAPAQFPTVASAATGGTGPIGVLPTVLTAQGLKPSVTFPDCQLSSGQVTNCTLAIELKTSWIDATSVPNPTSYITMSATVPTYKIISSSLWMLSGTQQKTLAMLGAHVVGSVPGHPEMIWATFEHFGTTPNAAYAYNAPSGATGSTPASGATGSLTTGWLFAGTGATGPFNQAHMQYISGFTGVPGSTNANVIQGTFSTAATGATAPRNSITASNTLEWRPFGSASNQTPNPLVPTPAASNTEVLSINNSVLTQMPAGDVRDNYYMRGATWTIGGANPNFPFGQPNANEVGTSMLTNSTMETYQQGTSALFGANFSNGLNCLDCHQNSGNTPPPWATTQVSHIFSGIKPLPNTSGGTGNKASAAAKK